jgi:hypothetical protein
MKLGWLDVEPSHVLLCEIVRVSADGLCVEPWKFVRIRMYLFFYLITSWYDLTPLVCPTSEVSFENIIVL